MLKVQILTRYQYKEVLTLNSVGTASGGMGKSKMCILHRSLNPVVTTAVSLPNAHAVWTVYGDDSAETQQQRGHELAESEATEPDVMHHVAAAAGQQVTSTTVQILTIY